MIFNNELRTITTERLLLRMFRSEDAEVVAKLCNNYNVTKSTLNLPYPYSIECALEWFEKHEENFVDDKLYTFAIIDKNTGELFGCISLSNNKVHKNGEIGYWIGEEYWGNGYATEATKSMIEFAFDVQEYHRVIARHFVSNPASGRVMQKAGMKYEGEFIDHIYKNDKFESLANYAIVNK
ncbi:GNAT family N-acetyltransferase [Sedimentibacter sp. zth1]|nr:GNAT family N-acetyltransferase [Sedimentibacter sp. zth1]